MTDRGRYTVSGSGGRFGYVVKTSSYSVSVGDSGTVFSNLGAAGAVTFTLPPSPSSGLTYTFIVEEDGQQLRIDPGVSTLIYSAVNTADKYRWADGVGEAIQMVSDEAGDWLCIQTTGLWTEEA